jgi:hypothetical protein
MMGGSRMRESLRGSKRIPPHRCEDHKRIVHDDDSSWLACAICKRRWDFVHYDRPAVAERQRERCRAKEWATDGPMPYEERCVYVTGHDGRHECEHGFHWGGAHA